MTRLNEVMEIIQQRFGVIVSGAKIIIKDHPADNVFKMAELLSEAPFKLYVSMKRPPVAEGVQMLIRQVTVPIPDADSAVALAGSLCGFLFLGGWKDVSVIIMDARDNGVEMYATSPEDFHWQHLYGLLTPDLLPDLLSRMPQ